MKKSLFNLFFYLVGCVALAQPAPIAWHKNYGGSQNDTSSEILQAPDGGYVVAGTSNSTDIDCVCNHGGDDFLVIKTDQEGHVLWRKCYGGTADDVLNTMILTDDGGYLLGGQTKSSDGDVTGNINHTTTGGNWLVKINEQGSLLWQTFMPLAGETSSSVQTIVELSNHNFVVAGRTYLPLSGFGETDAFVTIVDQNGAYDSNDFHIIGGELTDVVKSIKPTTDGGYVLSGFTYSRTGIFAENHSWLASNSDAWVIKLNAALEFEWHQLYGASMNESALNIELTSDGGFVCFGNSDTYNGGLLSHGSSDYWLFKIDSAGALQWQKYYGGSNHDVGRSLKKTADDGFLLFGWALSNNGDVAFSYNNWDYWLIKTNSAGEMQWQKCLGTADFEDGVAMHQNTDGSLILTGNILSQALNTTGLHGGWDIWLVKVSAEQMARASFENKKMVLYPNPVDDLLTIDMQTPIQKVTVTDLLGHIVCEQNQNLKTLATQSWPAGVYLIKVYSNDKTYVSKLIKR
ncbi:MAG: T9SS type A sorting domain-containing protein [Bacteroidetes bacterium]|nr:T9SS type A sorting domain-containing protein [Bacteroidota bacterium]